MKKVLKKIVVSLFVFLCSTFLVYSSSRLFISRASGYEDFKSYLDNSSRYQYVYFGQYPQDLVDSRVESTIKGYIKGLVEGYYRASHDSNDSPTVTNVQGFGIDDTRSPYRSYYNSNYIWVDDNATTSDAIIRTFYPMQDCYDDNISFDYYSGYYTLLKDVTYKDDVIYPAGTIFHTYNSTYDYCVKNYGKISNGSLITRMDISVDTEMEMDKRYNRGDVTPGTNRPYCTTGGSGYNTFAKGTTHLFVVKPLKWRIVEKTNRGDLTLISDKILDAGSYGWDTNGTVWEFSPLRQWLNGKREFPLENGEYSLHIDRDFFNMAFSEAEQNLITNSEVIQDGQAGYSDGRWHYYSAPPSGVELEPRPVTVDKIFIMGTREFTEADGFSNEVNRTAYTTEYSVATGAWDYALSSGSSSHTGWYLLMDSYCGSATVKGFKVINNNGGIVDTVNGEEIQLCEGVGIRPMLKLNLERTLLNMFTVEIKEDGGLSWGSNAGNTTTDPTGSWGVLAMGSYERNGTYYMSSYGADNENKNFHGYEYESIKTTSFEVPCLSDIGTANFDGTPKLGEDGKLEFNIEVKIDDCQIKPGKFKGLYLATRIIQASSAMNMVAKLSDVSLHYDYENSSYNIVKIRFTQNGPISDGFYTIKIYSVFGSTLYKCGIPVITSFASSGGIKYIYFDPKNITGNANETNSGEDPLFPISTLDRLKQVINPGDGNIVSEGIVFFMSYLSVDKDVVIDMGSKDIWATPLIMENTSSTNKGLMIEITNNSTVLLNNFTVKYIGHVPQVDPIPEGYRMFDGNPMFRGGTGTFIIERDFVITKIGGEYNEPLGYITLTSLFDGGNYYINGGTFKDLQYTGACFTNAGSIIVNDGSFENICSIVLGNNATNLTINGGIFEYNSLLSKKYTSSAHALFDNCGVCSVNDGKFIKNGCSIFGSHDDVTLIINGGIFKENTADNVASGSSSITSLGGAIYMSYNLLSNPKIFIRGGTFEGNLSNDYGGCFVVVGGQFEISGGDFCSNGAPCGGVLFCNLLKSQSADIKISHARFKDNQIESSVNNLPAFDNQDNQFDETNKGKFDNEGDVFCSTRPLTISNCIVEGNGIPDPGNHSCIYMDTIDTSSWSGNFPPHIDLEMVNCQFHNNHKRVYSMATTQVEDGDNNCFTHIDNCIFDGNKSGISYGWFRGGISNSTFTGNANLFSLNNRLYNCTVENNTGYICKSWSAIFLIHSIFRNNDSGNQLMFASGYQGQVWDNVFTDNRTSFTTNFGNSNNPNYSYLFGTITNVSGSVVPVNFCPWDAISFKNNYFYNNKTSGESNANLFLPISEDTRDNPPVLKLTHIYEQRDQEISISTEYDKVANNFPYYYPICVLGDEINGDNINTESFLSHIHSDNDGYGFFIRKGSYGGNNVRLLYIYSKAHISTVVSDYVGVYDGLPHGLIVNNNDSSLSFTYNGETQNNTPVFIESGVYAVKVNSSFDYQVLIKPPALMPVTANKTTISPFEYVPIKLKVKYGQVIKSKEDITSFVQGGIFDNRGNLVSGRFTSNNDFDFVCREDTDLSGISLTFTPVNSGYSPTTIQAQHGEDMFSFIFDDHHELSSNNNTQLFDELWYEENSFKICNVKNVGASDETREEDTDFNLQGQKLSTIVKYMSAGGIIHFDGTYSVAEDEEVIFTKPIRIERGKNIRGEDFTGTIFNVEAGKTLTIYGQNNVFIDGNDISCTDPIFKNSGTLNIRGNVNVSNADAVLTTGEGSFLTNFGTVNLDGIKVSNCGSRKDQGYKAGAIYNGTSAQLNLYNAYFTECYGDKGGVIRNEGGEVNICSCNFYHNASYCYESSTGGFGISNGGTIYSNLGSVNIYYSKIRQSSVWFFNDGGGISQFGSDSDINKFNESQGGGAIYVASSNLYVGHVTFEECYSGRGGAIYIVTDTGGHLSTAIIENDDFKECHAWDNAYATIFLGINTGSSYIEHATTFTNCLEEAKFIDDTDESTSLDLDIIPALTFVIFAIVAGFVCIVIHRHIKRHKFFK